MSRHSPEVDRVELELHRAQSMETSRSGGSSNDSKGELAAIIDEATKGKPTFSQLVDRLDARGVAAIPSINARGLNGMSYRFQGQTIKGSDIGRAYTANGLQNRKEVRYVPERDTTALRIAWQRAQNSHERRPTAEPDRAGRLRDSRGGLSRDQWEIAMEIGRFRAVSSRDLIRYRYAGDGRQFALDLRTLREAGLVERRSAAHPKSGRTFDVVVLTPRGRTAVRTVAMRKGSEQRFYAGFVKPTEIGHDTGIYRMYQREREFIEAAGGRVTRIVMDFEIKNRLMSELNKRGADPRDLARKAIIAERNGIALQSGRFVIPDVRVEYKGRDESQQKVDLELATADYKSSQVAAKRAAGLKIYGPDSASGGTPWEPEYSVSLMSI
jgi:DNA-binding MarR family transcriptional regulator